MLDRAGSILSANRSAEALFGYDARELAGRPFFELFAPESVDIAATYLDSVCETRRREHAEQRARRDRARAPGRIRRRCS